MQETKVHEGFIITRSGGLVMGERLWDTFATFENLPDAEQAYKVMSEQYGINDIRLERHTIVVLAGPLQ